MEKEIAVTDRMHPCAARWSMIAIGMDLLPVWLYASVVICAVPQAVVVFHTHTASLPV